MKIKNLRRKKERANNEDPEHCLFEAIASVKNAEEAKLFLTDLCTPAELQAMADRWHVLAPIVEGKSYRKIYEETGVSVTTIGRVARFIHQGSGGYNLIFNRLKKKKNATTEKTQYRDSKKGEAQ